MTANPPIDLTRLPPALHWQTVLQDYTTIPTLQVVNNPKLRRGSEIHDRSFAELQALNTRHARIGIWYPYPYDAVAELYPPETDQTHWDFTRMDDYLIDFFSAMQGRPVFVTICTIPQWMFIADQVIPFPQDPDQPIWNYLLGTELRDPSLKELSDYFARVFSWYTQGGFTDELGVWHESGHRYKIDTWEVFNEPDLEHAMTARQYTRRYDAIVEAIHKIDPDVKFAGVSLAAPGQHPEYFEYFLDPANHKPGIPLDMVTYHFYAAPALDENLAVEQHTYFAQADGFLNTARYIEHTRRRLSPGTRSFVNEIGVIRADDALQFSPEHTAAPIPHAFWNLSGALYAYVFAGLARLGVHIAGESQLMGYPSQFPSVTLLDWNTGKPNARLRVLELLNTHLREDDCVIDSASGSHLYLSQAFLGKDGSYKLLLVNKRDQDLLLNLPGFTGAQAHIVDQDTAGGPARHETLPGETLRLPAFGVALVQI